MGQEICLIHGQVSLNLFYSVDIDALFLAALWLSHWARGCGLVEQPTASSRFGSTGVLWV